MSPDRAFAVGHRRSILVYDGDCGFCTSTVRWMLRWVRRPPDVVAWQHADLPALGLDAQRCAAAVQWVGPDGTILAGHLAMAQALTDAGGAWGVVGRLLRLPGVSAVAARVYRWVSENRQRMPGGTAACALPAAERPGAAGRSDSGV